jgi:hypothetical protein
MRENQKAQNQKALFNQVQVRTSAAWACKQRRDKPAKHAELHEDEQPFEAAL